MLESEAELTEISSREILDKIQKGEPVEYDHIIVNDRLDLHERNLTNENEKPLVKSTIKITNSRLKHGVNFANILFNEEICFNFTEINGLAYIEGTTFGKLADFFGVTFGDWADFAGATFQNEATFQNVTFRCLAIFLLATFRSEVTFSGATFDDSANFERAIFQGEALFLKSTFNGEFLTFENAKFYIPGSQSDACRRAKNLLERNGEREDAGYHFYHEMEGKRKQKPWYYRYPEYVFIQLIFGYGVHPFRLMACWFGFVFLFAACYFFGHGIDATASQLPGNATWADYTWFSIATAVTPGYAGYKPTSDFEWVAGLEAIFGTFMWAAFIATFARKYMS